VLSLTSTGSFKNTESFLKSMQKIDIMDILDKCGQDGVAALGLATPTDSGMASTSWYYEVSKDGSVYDITWFNSDVEDGFAVAIMLQYGHGTGTGGYIQGQDYINPAIKPIFDQIEAEVWKAVTAA
jgi:hypothetical protein